MGAPAERRPLLVVIDEAHNVCPQLPEDALERIATETAMRIAAEGRKFGLYLLLSTQRPQKVHENILSQADNLVLMRMNSAADLARLTGSSFVPPSLIAERLPAAGRGARRGEDRADPVLRALRRAGQRGGRRRRPRRLGAPRG